MWHEVDAARFFPLVPVHQPLAPPLRVRFAVVVVVVFWKNITKKNFCVKRIPMVRRPTKFVCYRSVLSIRHTITPKGSKHSPNQSKSLGEGCNLPWDRGASKSNLGFFSVRKTMNVVVFEQMKRRLTRLEKTTPKVVRRIRIVMTHLRRCQIKTSAIIILLINLSPCEQKKGWSRFHDIPYFMPQNMTVFIGKVYIGKRWGGGEKKNVLSRLFCRWLSNSHQLS